MEQLSHIFSIGHGSKDIKELILELQSFDIEFLVDIRSKPYSKFYTHFNQGFLKYSVEEYHIKGVHLHSGCSGKLFLMNCSSSPTGISCVEGVVTM